MHERTLVILKPDALERGLERVIFEEIRHLGLAIGDTSVRRLEPHEVRAHYPQYVDWPFFMGILAFMTRGPCAIVIVEGEDAVRKVRALAGATRPDQADPASLRARFGRVAEDGTLENVLHASSSWVAAEAEIRRFFGP